MAGARPLRWAKNHSALIARSVGSRPCRNGKPALFLDVESLLRHLVHHAAERQHRLVGLAQQAAKLSDVVPDAALARQRRSPGDDIDAGIARHDCALVGGHLERRWNADVERVFRRNAFLHMRHQGCVGGGTEFGHHRAFGFGIVVEQIDRAARGGDEADARALRQPAALERQRALHEIVERAAIDDAVAFAHRQIRRIVAADGAGMRARRRARFLRGAGLDRQHRLAGLVTRARRRA